MCFSSLCSFADQYLKCMLHMMAKTRAMLATERGLEWPCMLLYPSHFNLDNLLLNLSWTHYLGLSDRKLLLEVGVLLFILCGCILAVSL